MIKVLQRKEVMSLELSSDYASQKNDKAKPLMQKMSACAHVMLTNSGLSDSLWAEAKYYGSWLRGRMLSKSVHYRLPIKN